MDARTKARRDDLGDRFSEGARLLWLAIESRGWTQADARRELGTHGGEIHRLLYGDNEPRLEVALRIQELLGIAIAAWKMPPSAPFVLPALRDEKAA